MNKKEKSHFMLFESCRLVLGRKKACHLRFRKTFDQAHSCGPLSSPQGE